MGGQNLVKISPPPTPSRFTFLFLSVSQFYFRSHQESDSCFDDSIKFVCFFCFLFWLRGSFFSLVFFCFFWKARIKSMEEELARSVKDMNALTLQIAEYERYVLFVSLSLCLELIFLCLKCLEQFLESIADRTWERPAYDRCFRAVRPRCSSNRLLRKCSKVNCG
jgi:hypothetical protein